MKFYGEVGYLITEETKPGVWTETIKTQNYYGDVIRNSTRFQNSENLNDDLTINHEISIMADAFAYEHCGLIRYVEFLGTKWKVTNVTVDRPRLTLSIGGVYNGPQT